MQRLDKQAATYLKTAVVSTDYRICVKVLTLALKGDGKGSVWGRWSQSLVMNAGIFRNWPGMSGNCILLVWWEP